MPAHKDITGQRYGRLVAVSPAGSGSDKGMRWNCVCDCGMEKIILGKHLWRKTGNVVSCGCWNSEKAKTQFKTHGKSGTRVYHSWCAMIDRCENENNERYKDYGGRGVVVCERWRSSFEDFYSDMGDPPPGCSIERIENDKGYEPGNCRWATAKEQGHNKRNNVYAELGGRRRLVRDWAADIGITYSTLVWRIQAWGVERALTTVEPRTKVTL